VSEQADRPFGSSADGTTANSSRSRTSPTTGSTSKAKDTLRLVPAGSSTALTAGAGGSPATAPGSVPAGPSSTPTLRLVEPSPPAPYAEPVLVKAMSSQGRKAGRHNEKTRLVVDDFGNAVGYIRSCSFCGHWKPLTNDFYAVSGGRSKGGQGFQTTCHTCKRFELHLRWRNDPETYRAKKREGYRRLTTKDPDARRRKNERTKMAQRRRLERDPEGERAKIARWQRASRERRKIDQILRDIDAGRTTVDEILARRQEKESRMPDGEYLPVAPLLIPLAKLALGFREDAEMNGAGRPNEDVGWGMVAEVVGVSDRTLREWRRSGRTGQRTTCTTRTCTRTPAGCLRARIRA
jgi:hypothetical protein